MAIAERLDVEIPRDRGYGHGKLVEELWENTVGDTLWAPTFVRDFPVQTTPLTREHRSIPGVTENGTSTSVASSWPPVTRTHRPGHSAGKI